MEEPGPLRTQDSREPITLEDPGPLRTQDPRESFLFRNKIHY